MVININPEQIETHQAWTNPLHWPSPAPPNKRGSTELATRSKVDIPGLIKETLIGSE